ncbi:Omp28-related outer membrane protein [bacterium]|nr:Omp28-related outer membrane protein [bacterium]
MKKFLTILILITLLVPFLGFYQVNGETTDVKRKVLMELFTATWCGPCAKYCPYADETYDMYGPEKVILLRNQIWDDDLDTEETNNRANFYGVSGVPTLYVNGKYEYRPAYYSEYRSKINEILKTISPISIKLDAKITKDKNLGNIDIEIEVFDNISIKSPQLIVTLFEKLVNYEGTNKEKTHRFVIRDYIYDEVGEKLNLKKGEKYKFNLPLIVRNGVNLNDFGIAAWVQDFSTLEVIQAEASDINVINNPTPPVIFSPKNKQVFVNDPIIKFISNYKKIRFQISDNENFNNILIDETIDTYEYEFKNIKEGIIYYLRAKSIDNSKESDWSEIIIFSKNSSEKNYSFIDINYNLYGGNLTSIIQDPKNSDILYVGSYGGGIYKSIDSGENWFNSSFGLECLYVNYLDIDKNNTNNILTATDKGVYISHDAGNSWIDYGLSGVNKIMISNDSKIIYTQSSSNLFKSNDYGRTWINITPNFSSNYCLDTFSFNLVNPLNIFLSSYSYDNSLPQLLYSENAGGAWKEIKLNNIEKYSHIYSIEFDPNDSKIIYVSCYYTGIYKSNDGGKSFNKINSPSRLVYEIKVNSNDSKILYANTYSELYISKDSGTNWKIIYNGGNINDFYFDEIITKKIYLILQSGEGILVTEDEGFNLNPKNYGINTNKILGISTYNETLVQTNTGLYKFERDQWIKLNEEHSNWGELLTNKNYSNEIFYYDDYYIYYSNNGGLSWKNIIYPPTDSYLTTFDIDFKNKIIYAISYNLEEGKYHLMQGNFYGKWEEITTSGLSLTYPPSPYSYTIKIDQNNLNVLYIGMVTYRDKDSSGNWVIKGGGFFKSTDSGKSWRKISLSDEGIYGIFIDPKDSNKIYVNTDNGFKRSTNAGLSWKLIFNEQVNTMAFHDSLSIIYANRGRNLIKSEDDGVTWTYIPWDYSINPVKPSKITSLSIDINDPNTVYIGTDGCGIYKYGIIESKITITNPEPPELSAYLKDDHILLSWVKPKEGTYPINGYEIYKKINEGEWKLLETLNSNTLEYEDYEIESGNKYHYYIVAFDTEKNYSEKSNEVSLEYVVVEDTQPPYLNITSPTSNNVLTNNNKITIIGTTYDNESGIMNLTINEKIVNVSKEGIFTYDLDLIEGENKIKIISTDNEGNKTEKELKVICDLTPPVINLNIPTETSNQSLSLEGVITDNLSGVKYLKINNSEVSVSEGIKFTYKINLNEGENIILLEVEDNVGNKTSKTYIVKYIKKITIILQIGNYNCFVNDNKIEMDTSPKIIQGRTYLPIRYIITPLGGEITWDSIEKKTTILFKEKIIDLWIGKNYARINGEIKLIDPDNPKVVPIIIEGRTMLPIRFVAENLGCKVDWDGATKTITITYPAD